MFSKEQLKKSLKQKDYEAIEADLAILAGAQQQKDAFVFIRRLYQLGLTLDEIKDFVDIYDDARIE